MKRVFATVLSCIICLQGFGQEQLDIDRVELMPDFPSPYIMKDWKSVAREYDQQVFDLDWQGEHLPIISVGAQGFNYPDIRPIFMDTYVGVPGSGQAEAINIIPAVVGASLLGIDKSDQGGFNWVESIKDFYNSRNGENIYLNNAATQSGNDWWYETMPNVFFYQLYSQYPDVPDFDAQFRSVADEWLEAVYAMGASTAPWTVPYMNYRAWDVKNDVPLDGGVPEPEAAGAIAWILYQAFDQLGDQKYLVGAQLALDFLDQWQSNPSYELQLPYGVLIAAKMNATLGTTYDIDKMVNWSFDRGDLRGWASVVGAWDDKDVSGLIGEANDQGDDYVFLMNGFQQAAALVPMVKYDKRYSAAIAKWILNLANASRLFYPNSVDPAQQSDYDWSAQYDPNGVVAYEAIKERWLGIDLYARGDSKDAGWAATNLALYGSSHVGYLGAIVEESNVPGILLLDVNATDFFVNKSFPTYLVYNPHDDTREVNIPIGDEAMDIYDAISERVVASAVSGDVPVSIEAKGVLLISLFPTGNELEERDGRLLVGGDVIDWHYGYDFGGQPYFRTLSARDERGETGVENLFYATVTPAENTQFEWYIDGKLQGSDSSVMAWTPDEIGSFSINAVANIGTTILTDSIVIEVSEIIPENPIITSILADQKWSRPGTEIDLSAVATDPKGLALSYNWIIDEGEVVEQNGKDIRVRLPDQDGIYTFRLIVSNSFDSTATKEIEVLVREEKEVIQPTIYLPFDGNVIDRSTQQREVEVSGTSFALDAKQDASSALSFLSSADEVSVSNADNLNFGEAITVSFWASINDFSEERFAVSHGGWEQRWKASVTTDKYLRWTVNTTEGIKDLDTSFPLNDNSFYHFTIVYTGYSIEVYVNGILDVFSRHSGMLNTSSSDLTIGKRLPGDDRYFWKGKLDEVKVFDEALDPDQISNLPNEWFDRSVLHSPDVILLRPPFPNPAKNTIYLESAIPLSQARLFDLSGRLVLRIEPQRFSDHRYAIPLGGMKEGLYLLQLDEEQTKYKILISNSE